jgi:hypothetical protein
MDLTQLLEEYENVIVAEAFQGLAHSHLQHYEAESTAETRARLQTLYRLIRQSVNSRNLERLLAYTRQIAQERFTAGYSLHELQVAFNVLEEAIWRKIVQELPPSRVAEALGLVSTVHGAGKDALATTYVSLATQTKVPSLNLIRLFEGVASP